MPKLCLIITWMLVIVTVAHAYCFMRTPACEPGNWTSPDSEYECFDCTCVPDGSVIECHPKKPYPRKTEVKQGCQLIPDDDCNFKYLNVADPTEEC